MMLYIFTALFNLNKKMNESNKLTSELNVYINFNYLIFNKQKTECIFFYRKLLLSFTYINVMNTELLININ